ncbi:hypothetical protein AKJ09_06951 [Labilithrix luteola]|uniref:Lipoprotein n=1 Tax=Labilithrix luteola TaxID=1391654 RepID=A0A0K1Q3I1_9BACT|nr:hypothetical protein [Labilithrix luteola]AKV00288.1 hypothetical protein AKJ09_06951 [Labilithrix luteola]
MNQRSFLCATVFALFPFALEAFLPACTNIETSIDCGTLCDRQRSCYQSNLDRNVCRDRCNDLADDNHTFRDQASDCSDCIAKRSTCAAVTDRCETVCAPVRERLGLNAAK